MPTPKTDESREDFVSRCIPIVLEDGTAEDQDQAIAICNSMWRQAQEEKTMKFINIDGMIVALEDLIGAYKAKWTTAYINDLADSAFLWIESGGEKDEDSKTTPRSLRHFPYKNAEGNVDLPHLQNSIGRIPQAKDKGGDELSESMVERLQGKARGILEKETEKSVSLSNVMREVEGAWRDQFASGPAMPMEDPGWVTETYDDAVIVDRHGKLYMYPYTMEDGEVVFGDPMEVEMVPQPVKSQPPLTPLALGEDAVISIGGAVKALGAGKTGGYLVEFTDPEHPDLEADYFDGITEYGPHITSLAFYHHGYDRTLGRRALKNAATLEVRDAGVWMEHQLELRDEYEAAIYQMADQGKLGLSSGTAPHLVEREQKGNAFHITRWPLGLDASYTPSPANWQSRVMPLKSYVKSVGSAAIDISGVSIPQDRPKGQDAEPKGAQAPGPSLEGRRGVGQAEALAFEIDAILEV